ncbi:sphingosine N-acyltransferase lag1 [Arachnomyces sp. PD_36]|nr:sphingosine N-acyltransferase lag1 [Arachnomyces sp. PD_36]
MLLAVHNVYPSLRPYTAGFFQLSHYNPETGTYVQGWRDIYFAIGSIIGFTAARAITIDWIFQPIARAGGLKRKASLRFAEQGWLVVYYGGYWSFGMYLWANSNYWLNFNNLWDNWPARDMSGIFKFYLLTQLSFWLQQILVINIEERRKDHYQMLTHHFITSTLLYSAYIYGFFNVANVVLCIMDIVDYMLPVGCTRGVANDMVANKPQTAKMLKYMGYERSCNIAFGVFLGTWLIARHVVYLTLCWSIYQTIPARLPYGCYNGATSEMYSTEGTPDNWGHLLWPFKDLDGSICMNEKVKIIFLSFLLFLQVLSIIWFTMIVRVAVKVLRTGAAEDSRSDDEGDEGLEEGGQGQNGTLEKDLGDASADSSGSDPTWRRSVMNNGPSQGNRIRTGRARVRLSDQSDRKALLGRIGCDKPT